MTRAARWRLVSERILEAMREIGILLFAFTPLDFALSRNPLAETWPFLGGFLVAAVLLFVTSIIGEWRLHG